MHNPKHTPEKFAELARRYRGASTFLMFSPLAVFVGMWIGHR